MPATHGTVGQPDNPEPSQDPATELSQLELALRRALDSVPRDQVVRCVVSVLPVAVFVQENARLHSGKVRKVSVSMPAELAEAVRARTGSGGFSRYVADAVEKEIRHDLLGDLIDELEAEYGPVSQQLLDEASREWPDYEAD
jgi:hypothetical protein